MRDAIELQKSYTFTLKAMPRSEGAVKTIRRLMRMQPDVQKGLRALARKRRQHDNISTIRAGVEWVNRKRPTRLTHIDRGESFTLTVTPKMLPDLESVAKYLDVKAA